MDPSPPDETPAVEPAAEAAAEPGTQGWRRFLPRRRPAAPADGPAAEAATDAEAEPDAPGGDAEPEGALPHDGDGAAALRRRRKKLLAGRQEAVYHLGGLAYELHRRDMLAEEVLSLRAGEVAALDDSVRDIDARLDAIERERRERRRRTDTAEHAGNCLACRAPFRAEARYCWQCGAQLVPTEGGDDQVTVIISAQPMDADRESR
ncbi:MAG: hypothetical protein AB7V42_02705 [Thermoleophilia bacterium]